MKITLNDLKEKPCERYDYLYKKYNIEDEFDALKEIKEVRPYDTGSDVAWLIRNCPKLQTPEMFEYYKDLIGYHEVSYILVICKHFRTKENFVKGILIYMKNIVWIHLSIR